jgi:DNA polymerase-3 subunit gamma/tau
MSFNNLRQQNKKMHILPGTPGVEDKKKEEKEAFTQDELELQWMAMCNRMPQRLSGIATRMKNMNPVIISAPSEGAGEAPKIEVVVPNGIILTEMEQIKGSILATMKLYLHNSAITMTLRVAEQEEKEKILTRREQFEAMVAENAAVEKLRAVFDLELA